jgi:glycosyltransferase involved in cell wall biosynthesis
VLSSWLHGAGLNHLGAAGYSYDYLARLYLPLFERLGEVHCVRNPNELEPTIERLQSRGMDPVHVHFAPFQSATYSSLAPNVSVVAWEFPDIPDHVFDGNPQNNWVATADRCAMVMVASPFTEKALVRSGVRPPVRVVPSPVDNAYFQMSPWNPGRSVRLDCPAYVFPSQESTSNIEEFLPEPSPTFSRKLKSRVYSMGRSLAKKMLSPYCYHVAQAMISVPRNPKLHLDWIQEPVDGIELSGVVYTSVFCPIDGRKNWEDLLTGFILSLRDCSDATLVIKLATQSRESLLKIINQCRYIGIPHQCKVVIISQYLSDEQMRKLAEASTYYVTTTRAEGICLPLMDYLAAGRPGISPCHTALADYFGPKNGFVVESHPEPTSFPHDKRLRHLTSWQRIVWTSLADQLQASYAIAKQKPAEYEAISWQAREILRQWASFDAVLPRLESALAELPTAETYRSKAA